MPSDQANIVPETQARRIKADGTPDMRMINMSRQPARNPHPPGERYGARNQAIPADTDPESILQEYLSHGSSRLIAERLGVARSTLSAWLRAQLPEEWRRAQLALALARKEMGDEGIEGSIDAFGLARARELLRSGQWDLERLDRATYGSQPSVSVSVTLPARSDLPDLGRIIEVAATRLPQSSMPIMDSDDDRDLAIADKDQAVTE